MAIDWTGVIIPVLGIIAGFFFSYYMWILSTNHQRRNIAIALKNDILKVVDRISPITDREMIRQAGSVTGNNTQFIIPFFDKDDLYYRSVRTEISTFDPSLSELIHDFYEKLGDAEELRKLLIRVRKEKNDSALYDCLFSIGELTQQIIPLLNVEIRWNILVPHGNNPQSQMGQIIVSLSKVIVSFCIILLVLIGVSTFISGTNEKTTGATSTSLGQQYTSEYNSNWRAGAQYTYPTYTQLTPTHRLTRPPEMKLSLGQTATVNSRKITVYSVRKVESSYRSGYLTYIFDVEITNTGDKDGMPGDYYTRDSDNHSGLYDGSSGQGGQLNSGESKREDVKFEFPSSAKDIKFYFKPSEDYTDTAQIVSWTVPN